MKIHNIQIRSEIVLLEDDPTLRELLTETLEPHPVHSFGNGKAALEWFERHPANHVQLVISDYNLPGLTGVETVARIRALAPRLKFILMSGTPTEAVGDLARQNHFDGCLQKPFSPSELEQVVESVLGENGQEISFCI